MRIYKIIYIGIVSLVLAACTGTKPTTTSTEANKKTVTRKMVDGYQLQVLNTTNRDDAIKAKSLLLSKYPQQKTFLMFQTPYYKIRFGNFVTRTEAASYQKKIKSHFANVFIIPSRFEIKVTD